MMAGYPLSKRLQQKAIIELNEDPSRIQEYVSHLREWAHKQPHLHIRTDDKWLLAFLRGTKYSLQRAKEKLDLYYTVRTLSPELFTNRNPFLPEVQAFFKAGYAVVLQNTSDELAPFCFFVQPKRCDPQKLSAETLTKTVFMMLDIYAHEDACLINGQVVIYDLEDCPYGYVVQLTPRFLKTFLTMIQGAYPSRVKGIYFLNTPNFLYSVINLGKQLLPEKIRNRCHFYTKDNLKDLYNIIPLSVFPNELGGDAGPFSELSDKLRLQMESWYDWFQEDSEYYSNESKRPGKPMNASDFFNMEGSFRKLDID